jgi:4-amino-4-deoxy-L-arabinose transferase-like glycosyltransferase
MGPALLLALVSFGVFFWIILQRLVHPFELEWMEGGSLQHLVRILSGEALYVSPSIDFVPYPYPPFYYYAAIPFTSLVGVNLLALRMVSLLATLASAAILFALVRHETRRWDLGVVAAGLFVATYRISGAYMDVGRIDSLFVALVLGGIYLLRVRDDSLGLVFAGVVAFLATMTKQTGLAVFGPLFLWCLYREWHAGGRDTASYRRTICFVGSYLGLMLIGTFLLSRGENTHFFFYILGAQSGHEIRWPMLITFFWSDLFLAVPLAVIAAVIWIRRAEDKLGVFFYAAYFIGTVLACIVPRIKVGGAMNNLIPLHASLVLVLGVALGALLHRHREWRWAAPLAAVCLVGQFAWLVFDPRIALPRPDDSADGMRLVKRLASIEGEVLIPAQGYLAGLAGKRVYAHQMPVDDLADSGLPGAEALRAEFSEAIAARRFEVIIDSTSSFLEHYPDDHVLKEHYQPTGPAFKNPRSLVPRSGWQVSPGSVWVPREGTPQATRSK